MQAVLLFVRQAVPSRTGPCTHRPTTCIEHVPIPRGCPINQIECTKAMGCCVGSLVLLWTGCSGTWHHTRRPPEAERKLAALCCQDIVCN